MKVVDRLLAARDQNRKILIVGMGISGIAASKFLSSVGIETICVDQEPSIKFKDSLAVKELSSLGVKTVFGVEGESIVPHLNDVALVILSPGVSLESPVVASIERSGISYIGELELGIELLSSEFVAVTGSNGKTTTVTLIHEMLKASGIRNTLCGNIGTPITSLCSVDALTYSTKRDPLVVECSSYQLETCTEIRPRVAVWLNLSDNHLERHGSLERYLRAKGRLFLNQKDEDLAVLNRDDPSFLSLYHSVKSGVATFGCGEDRTESKYSCRIYYEPWARKDEIHIAWDNKQLTFGLLNCKLLGLHNRYNIAAGILASLAFGGTEEGIRSVLNSFETLEHRIEFVSSGNGVRYLNDSKSTTVASTKAAVDAVSSTIGEGKLVLLIGGLSKIGSWQPLLDTLKQKKDSIRAVICFGEDGRLLADHCRAGGIDPLTAKNVREAVVMSGSIAHDGDVVLFSPGCASFDEFDNFEERGVYFKTLVRGNA